MRTCIICGCTDALACPEGCHWVQILSPRTGRCSACPPLTKSKLSKAQREDRKQLRQAVRTTARRRAVALALWQEAESAHLHHVELARRFEEVA